MNGRIYDPTLGRFLQADPHIQAPMNSQNYNRYSYVLNNPMSYTDPSGYFFKSLFKGIKKYWRVIAAAAVTWATAGAVGHWAAGWAAGAFGAGTTAAAVAGGALTGAIAGAAGGFVATGSLKGAMQGALTGAVFGGLGGYGKAMEWGKGAFMAGHGVAGGIISDLQGGKFGHGFFTAGIMKGVGMSVDANFDMHDVGKTIIMAIAGGTVSKLTGGKFANGATTSAIQFVVNQLGKKFDQFNTRKRAAKEYAALRDELNTLEDMYKNNRDFLRAEMEVVGGYEFSSERQFETAYITLTLDMNVRMTQALNSMMNGATPIVKPKVRGNTLFDVVSLLETAAPIAFTVSSSYSYDYDCSSRGCSLGTVYVE